MDFALSGFLFIFPSGFSSCLLRENFHGLCPQWLPFHFPQRIFISSHPREFSWISPSVVSFLFSPEELYMSLREGTTDFAFNGFTFCISPEDLYCVSSRGNHRFCLQWLYIFISLEDLYCVSSRRNHRFCLQRLYILYFLRDLHRVSLRENHSDGLPTIQV